jgi:hypothetical protein
MDAAIGIQPRIQPPNYEDLPPESTAIWDDQMERYGAMTTMKRTLALSPIACESIFNLYPMIDKVASYVGKRAALIFVHAVSSGTDCLICSVYFRKHLIDSEIDPDNFELTSEENALVEFGQAMTRNNARVPDEIYNRLGFLSDTAKVDLVVLAGLMMACNFFNNALNVQLDDFMAAYVNKGP